MNKFKLWIKSIVVEAIKEEIKKTPMIISSRVPNENDCYERGTIWLHGNTKYICNKITAEWLEL